MIMMSPKTMLSTNDNGAPPVAEEWVEIVEPRSKQTIYANLETGVCAKKPPYGTVVSRSEDFSDHWWELYDQKTGKYYYYNPERQKTVWTRPRESPVSNGEEKQKRLLIIPVSRLQTLKRVPSDESNIEKCDASTQTVASNLVSTGTQTILESKLESEFNSKLKFIDLPGDSSKPSSCVHLTDSKSHHLDHRHLSDLGNEDRTAYLKNMHGRSEKLRHKAHEISSSSSSSEQNRSSQQSRMSQLNNNDSSEPGYMSYFGPPHTYHRDRALMNTQSPGRLATNSRHDDHPTSTSTFGNSSKPPSGSSLKQPQQMTTNNLSHYLVREARAMGIALISDDELDDDDQDSDDDCVNDDDDDTDMRDDASSLHGAASDLNVSQDLGEDSSEGWKSFSDQESPNSTVRQHQSSHQSVKNSPNHCETSAFSELIDDEKDPASCMSQQLDHRKLVENFKKSRQTSSFGLHDAVGRNYRLDANHAVQRIKTVADSYFNHERVEPISDKHLRQLSTLSTLPRPNRETKDKVALSRQEDASRNIDADYDVVEENCGYYSDSEQANQSNAHSETDPKNSSNKSTLPETPHSPKSHFDRNKSSRGSTFSVESFARENLTRHPKKGGLLFNRKVKWSRMISWTKSSIKQPMISSVNSSLNSSSIASFKLIQQFMGDRKVVINKKYRQILAQSGVGDEFTKSKGLGRSSSMNSGNASQTSGSHAPNIPDRLRDELAYELVVIGCSKVTLRDEIYVQMARQLTENPSQESVDWGMILISILLSYFSPSSKFSPFLLSFLETHSHQMAQDVCLPRLDKHLRQNWLTYCRKPADGKEISIVRLSITKWPQYCGIFGESLERIMSLQTCSPYLKTLRLPWILTTLREKLIDCGGAETEGIFRCAADHDLISQLRLEIDCVDFRKITDAKQVRSLLSNVQDPHVIASLLKLFFRQLYEPIFPSHLYDTCLQSGQDAHATCRVFNERLSNLNKDIIAYLVRLLQLLAKPEKVAHTKMDNSNLSMVWAPNLLRAPNQDQLTGFSGSANGSRWSIANGNAGGSTEEQCSSLATSRSMIFEQTRQEMQFIRSLIVHLDTSFIENVV